MMKKYRLFPAICLVAALLLSACSQDELTENTALPEGEYPLQIGSVTLTAEVSEQPWTRVSENQANGMSSVWKDRDKIGVRIGDNEETGIYVMNVDAEGRVVGVTPEKPVYWKDKQPATITAWYPVKEELDFTHQDQGLTYLLQGTSTSNADYNTSANLTFSHQLAKVRVKLEGTKADEVTAVTVRSYPKATHNQGTNVTKEGDAAYYPMREANYGGETYWEANLLDGYLEAANTFRVSSDGKNFVQVKLTEDVNIDPGYVHTININVGEAQQVTGEISDDGYYLVSEARNEPVTITGGSPTVYLKGASINVSDGPAISITGGTPTIHVIGEGNSVSSSNNTGIAVSDGATVTIEGSSTTDVLTAEGGTSGGAGSNSTAGAGIGSPIGGMKGGNIIIRNVTIHATGGEISSNTGGAGIGSSSNGTCGDIMIANAVIFATGGDYAAAIGMGCNSYNDNFPAASIGAITITNSDITANGGYAAAAIGFSACYTQGGAATYCSGKITITTDDLDKFLSCLTLDQGYLGDRIAAKKIGKGQQWPLTPSTFRNTDNTAEWEGVVINGTEYKDGVD